MPELTLVEPQPRFPHEDLSDLNADYLGLVIANHSYLQVGHDVAERCYPIFTGTHPPLEIASGNVFMDPDQSRAVELGIRAFEAITAYVRADVPVANLLVLERNANAIVSSANTDGVAAYFNRAYEQFLEEAPRTAQVVAESASHHKADPTLAKLGGAVARRFELDNVGNIER